MANMDSSQRKKARTEKNLIQLGRKAKAAMESVAAQEAIGTAAIQKAHENAAAWQKKAEAAKAEAAQAARDAEMARAEAAPLAENCRAQKALLDQLQTIIGCDGDDLDSRKGRARLTRRVVELATDSKNLREEVKKMLAERGQMAEAIKAANEEVRRLDSKNPTKLQAKIREQAKEIEGLKAQLDAILNPPPSKPQTLAIPAMLAAASAASPPKEG